MGAPKWAREQGARIGLSLDAAAAKALVSQVGERQQRLLRELEKLLLEGEPGEAGKRNVGVEEIEQRSAHSAEYRAFALADALVGADAHAATLAYMRLREQGERLSGLIYLMGSARTRSRSRCAWRQASRRRTSSAACGCRRVRRRFVADVARSDPARLHSALGTLADLELDSRGGAVISADRTPLAALSEDTLALRAIESITS